MVTVKVLNDTSPGTRQAFLREYMFPENGVWDGCRFDFSLDCRKYDWLVVFHCPMRAEQLACPRENTLLVICEPASVRVYPDNYLQQFGGIVDLQKRGINRHPNLTHYPAIWDWGSGFIKPNGERMRYEEMLNMPPPQKHKWLSVMSSNKAFSKFHRRRIEFCTRFARENPGADFYGAGINTIDDKAGALLPYHFHLAVENLCVEDYWTEKIAESYLAYCFTAYCGCPNIADYFPPESVVPVDINNYAAAADTLKGLDEGEYNRRLQAVREARHLLLTKYHPAAKLAELINNPENQRAENNGVIRTIADCSRRSGILMKWKYLLKKRRYKPA